LAHLQLNLQFESGCKPDDWPLSRPRVRRLILASLPANCTQAQINVVVMGAAKARRLNRDYRGQDHATNILTFPYAQAPSLHADLVLCMPVIKAEARQQGKRLDHHAAHLMVHGVLHASGMDHQRKADAEAMEWLEAAILGRFRIPHPYAATVHPQGS
jgi:probable rRNA maturation factor